MEFFLIMVFAGTRKLLTITQERVKWEKELKGDFSFDFSEPIGDFCWSLGSRGWHIPKGSPGGAAGHLTFQTLGWGRNIWKSVLVSRALRSSRGASLALIREWPECHKMQQCSVLSPASWPVPEGLELYWLPINAFLHNLGLVSFSFSALLGLVSQNGIFLSDKIKTVSL